MKCLVIRLLLYHLTLDVYLPRRAGSVTTYEVCCHSELDSESKDITILHEQTSSMPVLWILSLPVVRLGIQEYHHQYQQKQTGRLFSGFRIKPERSG